MKLYLTCRTILFHKRRLFHRLVVSFALTMPVIFLMLKCDTFDTDASGESARINKPDGVTTYVNNDLIIPVSSWISSAAKLKIECINQPTSGYLVAEEGGNFRYTPFINAIGPDEATFTVRSLTSDEELLEPQTVRIDIHERGDVNCNLIPMRDVAYSEGSKFVSVFPVVNDLICAEYKISIYKPHLSFMPHHGTAIVKSSYAGISIEYSSNVATLRNDTVMYKIASVDGSASASYGLIFISADDCPTLLRDDFVILHEGAATINLLQNDNVCFEVLDVGLSAARYGQIENIPNDDWDEYYLPGSVMYTATSASPWTFDTIEYKICKNAEQCFTGRLIVSTEKFPCTELTNDDHIIYSSGPNQSVTIDVLANDELCGSTNLSIITLPQHGKAEIDLSNNTVRYTPRLSLNDAFEYVSCNNRVCKTGRVYIEYSPR